MQHNVLDEMTTHSYTKSAPVETSNDGADSEL